MQCLTCCGLGRVTYDDLPPELQAAAKPGAIVPCPDCGGSGTAHCGDGNCDHHGDEGGHHHHHPHRPE